MNEPIVNEPIIRTSDLHKSFGSLEVLRGIDFEVTPGEVVVVIGPSGCGKSTLLRCLNGLERATKGTIRVAGHSLDACTPEKQLDQLRTDVGMVFQRFHLFPHLSVLGNLTLAPRLLRGQSVESWHQKAREVLSQVHLGDKTEAFPSQLSGGQQQRAAIARALMMEPKALLFDEPTSALDPELVGEVLEVMRELANGGKTMVVVTHEMSFAAQVASRVVFMDAGQIVEQGEPRNLLTNPQHPRTREFLARLLNS
jgi:polar amino acid transport system ATP-binding protein